MPDVNARCQFCTGIDNGGIRDGNAHRLNVLLALGESKIEI